MKHNSRINYINVTSSEVKRDKNGKTYFELIPEKPINPDNYQIFGGGGGDGRIMEQYKTAPERHNRIVERHKTVPYAPTRRG